MVWPKLRYKCSPYKRKFFTFMQAVSKSNAWTDDTIAFACSIMLCIPLTNSTITRTCCITFTNSSTLPGCVVSHSQTPGCPASHLSTPVHYNDALQPIHWNSMAAPGLSEASLGCGYYRYWIILLSDQYHAEFSHWLVTARVG